MVHNKRDYEIDSIPIIPLVQGFQSTYGMLTMATI